MSTSTSPTTPPLSIAAQVLGNPLIFENVISFVGDIFDLRNLSLVNRDFYRIVESSYPLFARVISVAGRSVDDRQLLSFLVKPLEEGGALKGGREQINPARFKYLQDGRVIKIPGGIGQPYTAAWRSLRTVDVSNSNVSSDVVILLIAASTIGGAPGQGINAGFVTKGFRPNIFAQEFAPAKTNPMYRRILRDQGLQIERIKATDCPHVEVGEIIHFLRKALAVATEPRREAICEAARLMATVAAANGPQHADGPPVHPIASCTPECPLYIPETVEDLEEFGLPTFTVRALELANSRGLEVDVDRFRGSKRWAGQRDIPYDIEKTAARLNLVAGALGIDVDVTFCQGAGCAGDLPPFWAPKSARHSPTWPRTPPPLSAEDVIMDPEHPDYNVNLAMIELDRMKRDAARKKCIPPWKPSPMPHTEGERIIVSHDGRIFRFPKRYNLGMGWARRTNVQLPPPPQQQQQPMVIPNIAALANPNVANQATINVNNQIQQWQALLQTGQNANDVSFIQQQIQNIQNLAVGINGGAGGGGGGGGAGFGGLGGLLTQAQTAAFLQGQNNGPVAQAWPLVGGGGGNNAQQNNANNNANNDPNGNGGYQQNASLSWFGTVYLAANRSSHNYSDHISAAAFQNPANPMTADDFGLGQQSAPETTTQQHPLTNGIGLPAQTAPVRPPLTPASSASNTILQSSSQNQNPNPKPVRRGQLSPFWDDYSSDAYVAQNSFIGRSNRSGINLERRSGIGGGGGGMTISLNPSGGIEIGETPQRMKKVKGEERSNGSSSSAGSFSKSASTAGRLTLNTTSASSSKDADTSMTTPTASNAAPTTTTGTSSTDSSSLNSPTTATPATSSSPINPSAPPFGQVFNTPSSPLPPTTPPPPHQTQPLSPRPRPHPLNTSLPLSHDSSNNQDEEFSLKFDMQRHGSRREGGRHIALLGGPRGVCRECAREVDLCAECNGYWIVHCLWCLRGE